MVMIQNVRKKNIVAMFLVLVFLMLTVVGDGFAHRRPYRHHHSKTKGAIIGGVAGAVGGGLIGGKKGAVIGAGAGGAVPPVPMRRISPMKCAAWRAKRSCVAASSARSLAMVAVC